ncbi:MULTISPECIES: ester cyclase [unclassified Streptomyces]|uniref:ester cyclase n=1 Tax=unclassified Streptomyces TaxID=2593676 RepID=UPI002E154DB6|nr:ester cyclase [Streptomyces sp. NBC_01235]
MNSQPTSARDVPTRVFAAFDAGDIDALDTLVSPDLVDHNLPPGAPSAIEGMKGMVAAMRDGFTNPHHEIVYQAETDDGWVVSQWVITATHTGPWFGLPATGRDVTCSGIDLARVVDGRIVEIRHVEELLQLQMQMQLTD